MSASQLVHTVPRTMPNTGCRTERESLRPELADPSKMNQARAAAGPVVNVPGAPQCDEWQAA